GRIRVLVSADGAAGLHLAVEDSGDGIDPAEAPRIFESFYQGDPRGAHGRLGLGLSIAREIVSSHGGRIWVGGAGKGKGATFHLTLPLGAAQPKETVAA